MSKTLPLGARIRYPITIVKFLKEPGDTIFKQEPILDYSFTWHTTVGDHVRGDTRVEKQTTIASWNSPVEGELLKWHLTEGQVVEQDATCMTVKEACSHEIQFQGLCAICGKDVTEVNWAAESRDTDRAPINMVHDQTNLTVSPEFARRAELQLQERLLEQRKLSLVVDLDQTIIHASVDPTIGEWQQDPQNPNYDSVKDVRKFQLKDEAGQHGLTNACWYYIKLRPHLDNFLKKVAERYELHVYTMGTRAYALNIAEIVDPDKKLFGNRVISRDENGSMLAKTLQRLFPTSTHMVVIIDDRADVWPRNRPNLIKVAPYDFFKGIGDINSSFLPKREDLLTSGPADEPANSGVADHSQANGVALQDAKTSALDEFVSMSGGDDVAMTQRQLAEQERTLEKQIKERPLQHMQEQLDREDAELEQASESQSDGNLLLSTASQSRHQLLVDSDHELASLEIHLTRLHTRFYEEYDKVVKLRAPEGPVDMPDVGEVLDNLKCEALLGTRIVLSGIIPQGTDIFLSEIGLQVISFGADLCQRITPDVTHLVVSRARPRTQKVRQALKIPSIKVVNQDWLAECMTQWRKVDEEPYLLKPHPLDRLEDPTDGDDVVDPSAAVNGAPEDGTTNSFFTMSKLKTVHTGADRTETVGESDLDDSSDENDGNDNVIPPELEGGQNSSVDDLVTFNWGEADEELDAFLASDDDDDDDNDEDDADEDRHGADDRDGDAEDLSEPNDATAARKRSRGDDTESETGNDTGKKQRLVRSRASTLLRAQYLSEGESSLPTPQITGDEDMEDDDLEAELAAEFAAEE